MTLSFLRSAGVLLVMATAVAYGTHAAGQDTPAAADRDAPRRDVAYGPAERQRLDFFPAPAVEGQAPRPVVVYFHGGGFRKGDKSKLSKNLTARLHARGISVAAVNYRFFTTDPLPAAMHDGARAVQFLREHAEAYRLDPERIAVTGSSAGAGISLWLNFHDDLADADADDPVARQSSRVSGAYVKDAQISYDPAYWVGLGLERLTRQRTFYELYGRPDDAPMSPEFQALLDEVAPVTHVDAGDPPVRADYKADLSIDDRTSPTALLHHPAHGVRLRSVCAQAGVPCEVYYKAGPAPSESADAFLARVLGVE